MRQNWIMGIVLGASMLAVAQQTPKIINAQFHAEPEGAGLSATVDRFQHSSGPLWFGYAVAAVPGSRFSVCSGESQSSMGDGCCGVYRLEESDNSFRSSDADPAKQSAIEILVRVDRGAIDKIRFVGEGCSLDAGGLSFTWLTGVSPDESIGWLANMVTADNRRLTDQAFAAIAEHGAERPRVCSRDSRLRTIPFGFARKRASG